MNKGDIVVLDYTLRLADTGEVITTTSEEEAKKAGIYKEGEKYEPVIVVVGEGSLLPGLEEAVVEMKEGEEKEIEIPPSKAYGERDPAKVKVYSLREFKKAGVKNVYPGMVVRIGNELGIVRSVDGGRVRVDFNNPYAGKTIKARVKVIKIVKEPKDKVEYLIKRRLPEAEMKYEDGAVTITLPLKYILADNIQAVKVVLADEIFKWVPEVKEVKFVEPIKRPEGEPEGEQESEGTQS
ncbi:TPA: peptidylprolyl isomerase [Desulfurococcaceae archaeon]|nr:peptidylprolyl isomerase [Desulfurococcaceae archaeon]